MLYSGNVILEVYVAISMAYVVCLSIYVFPDFRLLSPDLAWTLFTGWWFHTFVIFHSIWDVILPIGFHIFSEGYTYTTNQITIMINHY